MAEHEGSAAPVSGEGAARSLTVRRCDYAPPAWRIAEVHLDVQVDVETQVTARLEMASNSASPAAPLVLDAREMVIDRVAIDGTALSESAWRHTGGKLIIDAPPERFRLETVCRIRPEDNTALEGFYASGPMYCTQCEAHGFSRITPYIDRPDVLAPFTVRLSADRQRFPVLLANGDCIDAGPLPEGQHFAVWRDPFAKPCYLFAMVAGDLACVEDAYTTGTGREIRLRFYVDHGNEPLTGHAIEALKKAMRWDEERFGLHYDLDTYMVVAARAFNMGAMENKGLNIFNAAYVLASPETATDDSFHAISAVIAHEYFHNWTGNRVTCRDWFQLSLKEGLTVYRDQRFSEDLLGFDVQRIEQARSLRALQFPEDAGPTAHPVRPEAYQEVNNFYTATVYEKGAEIVRMLATRIGEAAFAEGLRRYLEAHDGQAATIEDFVAALSEASGVDLAPFLRWYAQAGTPEVRLKREWQPESGRMRLHLSQETPATPGQTEKAPLPVPLRLRLRDTQGGAVPLPDHPARIGEDLLLLDGETLTLDIPASEPLLPALPLAFSAPVRLQTDLSALEIQSLAVRESDAFVRWDAVQQLQIAAHEGLMRGDEGPLQPLLVALQHICAKPPEDDALTAQLLALPRLPWLWEQYPRIHPPRFVEALERQTRAIARALCGPLSVWVQRNPQGSEQWRERALVNVATGYLLSLESESVRSLARRRAAGANMTLAVGALQGLNRSRCAERGLAMGEFRQRWKDQPLVLDRWFSLAAGSPCCDIAGLRELLADPAFDWHNPNRVRAVLASFARDNPGQFHSPEGYAIFADALARLDSSNPQLAARLSRPLLGFDRLESPWSEAQRTVVQELRERSRSLDLQEMLDAALGAAQAG